MQVLWELLQVNSTLGPECLTLLMGLPSCQDLGYVSVAGVQSSCLVAAW